MHLQLQLFSATCATVMIATLHVWPRDFEQGNLSEVLSVGSALIASLLLSTASLFGENDDVLMFCSVALSGTQVLAVAGGMEFHPTNVH